MIRSFIFISCFLTCQVLFAWGRTGHQIIGHVADAYTTEKTKAAIHLILGNESLSEAGTWMDDVMSDDRYRNMDNWHYCKKDETLDHNALIMIEKFTLLLKDEKSSSKDKVLALRGLSHMVGDVHQPLHCGYMKDAGGNTIKLKWKHPSSKTNLHKVWDTDMIKMKMKTESDYGKDLLSNIKKEQVDEWNKTESKVWVEESQSYLDQVYKYEGSHLDHDYYNKNIGTVDMRLSQAGVRLAMLLNSIFDSNVDG